MKTIKLTLLTMNGQSYFFALPILFFMFGATYVHASTAEGYVFEKSTLKPLSGIYMYYGCGGASNYAAVTDANGFYNFPLTITSGTGCGLSAVAVLGAPDPIVSTGSSLGVSIQPNTVYQRNLYLDFNADLSDLTIATNKAQYRPSEPVQALLTAMPLEDHPNLNLSNFNNFRLEVFLLTQEGEQLIESTEVPLSDLNTTLTPGKTVVFYSPQVATVSLSEGTYLLKFIAQYAFTNYTYSVVTQFSVEQTFSGEEVLTAIKNLNGNVAAVNATVNQNNSFLRRILRLLGNHPAVAAQTQSLREKI